MFLNYVIQKFNLRIIYTFPTPSKSVPRNHSVKEERSQIAM